MIRGGRQNGEHVSAEDRQYIEDEDSAQALGTVLTTAVVTAAVVPFVQALAKKAAEDSYDAVRSLLRKAFRAARKNSAIPARPLLVVKNDDPGLNAVLYAKPDMTDEAIRALADLDLGTITGSAKVQIFWNERTGSWQIDRK